MPTQNERNQATRDALIDAGRALFAERGYAEVSVGELAQHAGVSTGALYHQFGSKQDLFAAVYAATSQGVSARIVQARASGPAPSLIGDCEVYLNACADPAFHRIVLVDGPAVLGWDRVLDAAQSMVEGSFAAALERGEVAEAPIEPLARMLAAAMKEAGVMIATAEDREAARVEAVEGARRLIAGLVR
ncbi:MAG TPA: TetR/AcrR family transcriptional regulator [Solirubrobacteraceae bacterium]|jgi:AcrR family transcriptional regulator